MIVAESGRIAWPRIEDAYTDEFGPIDLNVYEAAGALWPQAEKLALSALRDAPAGLRLMVKAAAITSRRLSEPDHSVSNLKAYLFQIYKHLVHKQLKKENGRRQIEHELIAKPESMPGSLSEDLDQKILIEQVIARMSKETREIFEYATLGYTFEEIGRALGKSGHSIRKKFRTELKKLIENIQSPPQNWSGKD